jgi:hypothetical protein
VDIEKRISQINIIEGDKQTRREPCLISLFFYFNIYFGKGGNDYGYECLVPDGSSVSIFYAMWICNGRGWFYQIQKYR